MKAYRVTVMSGQFRPIRTMIFAENRQMAQELAELQYPGCVRQEPVEATAGEVAAIFGQSIPASTA